MSMSMPMIVRRDKWRCQGWYPKSACRGRNISCRRLVDITSRTKESPCQLSAHRTTPQPPAPSGYETFAPSAAEIMLKYAAADRFITAEKSVIRPRVWAPSGSAATKKESAPQSALRTSPFGSFRRSPNLHFAAGLWKYSGTGNHPHRMSTTVRSRHVPLSQSLPGPGAQPQ